MIYWSPFLHFYQPPTQYRYILDRIVKESYRPLIKVFGSHATAKVTVNMSGVLTEMLDDYGYQDVIGGFRKLSEQKKLEFVESAKFHAILPLIPPEETQRQIQLNRKTNVYLFGASYRPRGFFLPEMCYSDDAASLISQMGYEWILVSGVACQVDWPLDVIYKAKVGEASIKVFFRDDIISNKISFKNIDAKGFVASLKDLAKDKDDIYIITAMDGETFGHHIKKWENLFLAGAFDMIEDEDEVRMLTISELLKKFPLKDSKPPRPSSWSTSREEIFKGNFYPLWKEPGNKIHALQWEHIDICLEMLSEAEKRRDNDRSKEFFETSRSIMDKALHSCQFWWANKSRMFWSENMINRGLLLQEEALFNAYMAIASSECATSEKIKYYRSVVIARDIAGKIRDQIFI